MEAIRQYVEEESAHELADPDTHGFILVTSASPIPLPAEADVSFI
jgi:hypothetical protein